MSRLADSTSKATLQNIKGVLFDLENSEEEETKQKIATVLSNYPMLQKAYEMRKSLVAFWDSASGTQEQLVERLNEWCKQAEQSGIDALKTFSAKLRTYALAAA
jgi:stearoyl-CoA desaturase (delta-9 desaturase)